MTKIDIISGYLGSGKTTFNKKMIEEALKCAQIDIIDKDIGVVVIEDS